MQMQEFNLKNVQKNPIRPHFRPLELELRPRRHQQQKTQTNLSAVPATALFLEREI